MAVRAWFEHVLRTPARETAAAAALVAVVTLVAYSGAVGHGFHYDDFHSVVRNPAIRSLANVPRFFTDPGLFSVNAESAMYRPLLLTSYALNRAATGAGPRGFHAANIVLHTANALLVLLLVLQLGQGLRGAALASALFALCPLNVEATVYVSSRSELLMALFFLASCWAHCRSRGDGGRGWWAASVALGSAALLTKSVAAVLPAALLLLDWNLGGMRLVRQRWARYLPYVALVIVYLTVSRAVVTKAMLAPVRSWDLQAWTQIKAAAYYLKLWSMPVNLSVEHQFDVSRSLEEGAVLAAAALVASLVVICVRALRGWRQLQTGLAWSVLCLGPSAVVPLIVLVNEHRLYLPSVGLSLAATTLIWAALRRFGPVAALGPAVYTLLIGVLTVERTRVWADETSLWTDATIKAPQMVKPHLRLADAQAAAGNTGAAEASYLRALGLRPQHLAARNNLGLLYLRRGQYGEAARHFGELVAVYPGNAAARLNLASAFLRGGSWREAREQYQRIAAEQRNPAAHQNLGHIALKYEADAVGALEHYDAALEAGGGPVPRLQAARGVALRALGRSREAEEAYRAALAGDSTLAETWHNLGNLLADQNRAAEARNALGRAAELAPGSGLAKNARARMQSLVP